MSVDVEHADVIQSHVLRLRKYTVIPTAIDNKMVVFVPILEDCGAVHDPWTWRLATVLSDLLDLNADYMLVGIVILEC